MSDLTRDLDALRIEREPDRTGVARWIVWTGLLILLAALGLAGWRGPRVSGRSKSRSQP